MPKPTKQKIIEILQKQEFSVIKKGRTIKFDFPIPEIIADKILSLFPDREKEIYKNVYKNVRFDIEEEMVERLKKKKVKLTKKEPLLKQIVGDQIKIHNEAIDIAIKVVRG